MKRYTIKDLRADFPTERACLEAIVAHQYPGGVHCPVCNRITKHHYMNKRRSISCQGCGHHVHPTADTIFHKTRTPLTTWFEVIYLMAQTRGGISAKAIERQTGVTYKTAWRMCRMIRTRLFPDPGVSLSGTVEVDEAYHGGKKRRYSPKAPIPKKVPVVAAVERGGGVSAKVIPHVRTPVLHEFITTRVGYGARVITDELSAYKCVARSGYRHRTINHSTGIFVLGDVHTNTVEGFWSLVKCGIRGVYRHVSPEYLQEYLDEYTFRFTHRKCETPMFRLTLRRLALPVDTLDSGVVY